MTSKSRDSILAALVAFTLLCTGFLIGWLASRHVVLATEEKQLSSSMPARGDAPETVRRGVLRALLAFQDGYIRRDIARVNAFMTQLFLPSKDDLVIGTDSGEWIHGYEHIEKFIRTDWQYWGDVRLDVDASVISAAGDAAWLATRGSVSFHGSPRPIRFTANLVRDDERWVFRQVQFQWENSGLGFLELIRPSSFFAFPLALKHGRAPRSGDGF